MTVFLLNFLWSLFDLGKCISNKLRNHLATLVVTFLLNGGLNQIIFRLRIRFCYIYIIPIYIYNIYIYIYIYIYTYIYLYIIYIYTHTHIYMYIYTYISFIYIYIYTYIYIIYIPFKSGTILEQIGHCFIDFGRMQFGSPN